MQNTLNLMKRKNESENNESFLEYTAKTLWKVFKKAGELLLKVIKRIIKEVWTNA